MPRELIEPKGDKRFVRRGKRGRFKESDDVGRSLATDRRKKAKKVSKRGEGDKGDNEAFAYAFDLLLVDDVDLRFAPLSDRKARLAKLLRKAKPGIRLSEHIAADGVTVFEHACWLGLEGIVSKRMDATYRSGRVKTWIKVKNRNAAAYTRAEDGSF